MLVIWHAVQSERSDRMISDPFSPRVSVAFFIRKKIRVLSELQAGPTDRWTHLSVAIASQAKHGGKTTLAVAGDGLSARTHTGVMTL